MMTSSGLQFMFLVDCSAVLDKLGKVKAVRALTLLGKMRPG